MRRGNAYRRCVLAAAFVGPTLLVVVSVASFASFVREHDRASRELGGRMAELSALNAQGPQTLGATEGLAISEAARDLKLAGHFKQRDRRASSVKTRRRLQGVDRTDALRLQLARRPARESVAASRRRRARLQREFSVRVRGVADKFGPLERTAPAKHLQVSRTVELS